MENFDYAKAAQAIKRYSAAKADAIALIIFTVVNLFCSFAGIYFLFSIYLSTSFFQVAALFGDVEMLMPVMLLIGLIVVAVYLVFTILATKKSWAMLVLAILFSIDTGLLGLDFLASMADEYSYGFSLIIDVAFHILILVQLYMGYSSGKYLEKIFPQTGVKLNKRDLDDYMRMKLTAENNNAANNSAHNPFSNVNSGGANGVNGTSGVVPNMPFNQAGAAPATDEVFPELNSTPTQPVVPSPSEPAVQEPAKVNVNKDNAALATPKAEEVKDNFVEGPSSYDDPFCKNDNDTNDGPDGFIS